MAVEQDVEAPFESELFQRFPDVIRDHELVEFFTDNYRVFTITGMPSHELEAMMDSELELIAEELVAPGMRSTEWLKHYLVLVLWRPCSVSLLPWGLSEVRWRRLVLTLPLPWWGRF